MNIFDSFWEQTVSIVWSLPLVILVISAGVYFSVISRLLPVRRFVHAIHLLTGKYDNPNDPGEVPHFHALTSALSGTIGMGNIAGVAIAITMGGPGAIFWMWVAGFFGMTIKFFTCTLSCLYRKQDEDHIEQGGPMYFIEVGLGKKFRPLAVLFAICGMVGCIPMFQANQLAGLLDIELGINRWVTGIVALLIVGIVILGDIKRVGQTTSRLVPFMFVIYLITSLLVISSNYDQIPGIITSIFTAAFGGEAIYGGVAGLTFKEVMITGIKRAVFSNEAGVGTEALAHGAARTSEPVREGLVASLGPFIDTHIVCTLTALVILSSGVGPEESGIVMAASAFDQAIPVFGNIVLFTVFALFAVSTMITYSYYSLKCSRYLFGKQAGNNYIYVYLSLIPLAANFTQNTVINIIDTFFALMVIPTLISTLLLSPQVIREMKKYFDGI